MMATLFERKLTSTIGKRGFMPLKRRPLDSLAHKCNCAKYPFCEHRQESHLLPCAPGGVRDAKHGFRELFRCGKWSCPECGRAKRTEFVREVNWILSTHRKGIGKGSYSALLTLTQRSRCLECDESRGWRYCYSRRHRRQPIGKSGNVIRESTQHVYYRRMMQYVRSLGCEYLCVREWTKGGVIHWHVVVVGLRQPVSVMSAKFKARWIQIHGSWHVDLRKTYKMGDGSGVGGYLGKYLTKEMEENADGSRRRRYSSSQGLVRAPGTLPLYRALDTYQGRLPRFEGDAAMRRWLGVQSVFEIGASIQPGVYRSGKCRDHWQCVKVPWLSRRSLATLKRYLRPRVAVKQWFGSELERPFWWLDLVDALRDYEYGD